jgi:hypothetical protein
MLLDINKRQKTAFQQEHVIGVDVIRGPGTRAHAHAHALIKEADLLARDIGLDHIVLPVQHVLDALAPFVSRVNDATGLSAHDQHGAPVVQIDAGRVVAENGGVEPGLEVHGVHRQPLKVEGLVRIGLLPERLQLVQRHVIGLSAGILSVISI